VLVGVSGRLLVCIYCKKAVGRTPDVIWSQHMEVLRILAKRVAGFALVLFGLSVIIFTVARLIPGDPARIALGPLATDEQVQSLRHEMGLDQPAAVQYFNYTQVTSRCSFQRELSGFQTRHRFEDLMVLNQESVTQYESQLNSALGAHILSHFIVKELGKDSSFRCVLFLELKQNMRL
jgi:hypothetical protein